MNKTTPFLFLLIILLICSSCNRQEKQINMLLKRVADIVERSPDSALILLDSIPYPKELNEENYSEYQLLQIQARDKIGKDISSDTSIYQVAGYFKKKKNPEKTALANFYCARVYQSKQQLDTALVYYLKAETEAQKINDNKLKGLIQFNIGGLNYSQFLYPEAIERFKQSNHYFQLAQDYEKEIVAYNFIANTFFLMHQNDSAFFCYHKGLSLAQLHNDSTNQSIVLRNMGVAFYKIEQWDRSKECFFDALSIGNNREGDGMIFLNIAKVYHALNLRDSATYYTKLALTELERDKDKNLPILANFYQQSSRMEEKEKKFEEALNYHHKYTKYLASILEERENQNLLEVQKKYSVGLVQNEKDKLLIERQQIYLLILFLILLIAIITLIFYRRNARYRAVLLKKETEALQDKAMLLEAEQNIYHLKELAETLSEKGNIQRNSLYQHLDILKKVAFMQKYLKQDEKERGKALLEKFNLIVYENREGFDWGILYSVLNEKYQGFFDYLDQTVCNTLNEDELKIALLTYDGFSNTEIALLLKFSVDTIQSKKTMIRKKLGIEKQGNIKDFLQRENNKYRL